MPAELVGMCGRFVLEATATEIVRTFGLDEMEDVPPRYNIAPTQPIVIVRGRSVPEGSNLPPREALLARWGLIPSWARSTSDAPLLINARSETATSKASFRNAMRRGRILVPASGFYEWRRTPDPEGGRKPLLQPFYVRPREGGVIAFAGLSEREAAGEPMDTAAIMTVDANETFRPIHHRMPIVIASDQFERWLDCDAAGPADVADLLQTPDDAFFEAVPVSDRVNKATNQGAELIERVEVEAETPVAKAPEDELQRDLFG